MWLLRRPISASDRIPDKFYVIIMEFLSLSRRRSCAWNVPSGGERGETDVFAGYHISYNEVVCFNFMLIFIATIVSTKQPITASPKPPIQSEFQFRVMRTTYSFRNTSLKLRSISSSAWNVPSGGERGETDVFAGYHISYNEVVCFNFMLIFIATIVSTKQPITASPKPPIQSEFQFRVMRTTYSFRNSSLNLRSIS